jgi:crotonobetainyl-CoA:carnitine CoA-transferase CaiB-like acyl-CoA transferase
VSVKALQGIRVVELANYIAGPSIGMLLADYGATVIKVESPSGGDGIRTWGNRHKDVGLYHKVLNRNKRSVTADLHTPLGREIVRRLAARADVVTESFRPGTLEKWQLGFDVLRAQNRGLILVRVSGFGQTGPYSPRAGFGSLAEAMTGFAYTNGFPDRPPLLPSFALADTTTGFAGAFLTLAALEARRVNGGVGQIVDLAIYESLLTLMGPHVIDHELLGVVQERAGSRLPLVAPRGAYRTRDDKWIAISAGADAAFKGVCAALELPALVTDPRFATNQARLANWEVLDALLRPAFARLDHAPAMAILQRCGAPAAPIYNVADFVADPHVQARGDVARVWDDELDCELGMQNVVGRLSETPGRVAAAGPVLGADNRSILIDELAFGEAELRAAGLTL